MRDFSIEYGPQWTYVVAPWGRVSRFGKQDLADIRNAILSRSDLHALIAARCRRPSETGAKLARAVVRALQVDGVVFDAPFSCGDES